MPPAPLVRDLRWGDMDDLVETYYRCYVERDRGAFIGISMFDAPPSRASEAEWFGRLWQRVLAGETVAQVAEENGHAVGLCTVEARAPPTHETGHVGTLGILVREGYRGRGVGESLLRATLEKCRPRFEVILLSVFTENARARRLYERLGFRRIGTVPREVRRAGAYHDGDLMVLERSAAAPGPSPSDGGRASPSQGSAPGPASV